MSPQRSRLRLQYLRDVSSTEGTPWTRQGTTQLWLYLHHEHSNVLLDSIFSFKADNGTRERSKPLLMEPSTPDVQPSFIIRCCPRQKRLGGLVHVPTRKDALPKSCTLSTTQTFHPYVVGNR